LTRPGDHETNRGPAPESSPTSDSAQPGSAAGSSATVSDLASDCDQAGLGSILVRLGEEISRPLELLVGGINQLMDDSSRPISEAERVQGRTILGLCDDLGRLTRECLKSAGPAADP
jgi:hypothetical protein